MTQVTPPGWYPDPGQTNEGPPTERWWDGKAWTDQVRPAGSGAAWGAPAPSPADPAGSAAPGYPAPPGYPAQPGAPAQPGYPGQPGMPAYPGFGGHPGYPGQPPATGRRGLRTGIAVAVAVAVLASIGVGVWALTKDDGGGGDRAGASQGQSGGPFGGPGGDDGDGDGGPDGDGGSGGSGGDGGDTPGPGDSRPPEVEGGGTVSDPINGISLKVPEGWTGQQATVGAQMSSDTTYKCPGDTSKTCTKGGAYSAPAVALGSEGTTPEEVAKADIAKNAKESYGGDSYGAITSHEVLASEAVTVAGQKGYQVRWKAVTSKGSDGYVMSLAFPSPGNPKQLVVVRCGLDTDQKVSLLDEITRSIKESALGGGTGQDV
ncbi:DUF2510 domain-containing protein [Streptomyces sp. NPDC006997]|uniref:DUF2510 domain-containing protein n=1 Tax=Streptomyces sp. NPDC006997 TaxID=3155356 RepID=UPI0033E73700